MTLVIDASVACKWFVDEADSAQAVDLLASGEALSAPDLVVAEVCNTLWKKQRTGQMSTEQAALAVERLAGFFDELVPGSQLAPRSFAIAAALVWPAYDCFYLALAEIRDTRLVTADARLLRRLADTTWARRAVGVLDPLRGT